MPEIMDPGYKPPKQKKKHKYIDFEPTLKVVREFIENLSDEAAIALSEGDFYDVLTNLSEDQHELAEWFFGQLYEEDLTEKIQPLTYAQRLRRAMVMRRYAAKIKAARARLRNRRASNEKLQIRARRKAIGFLRARILKGRTYADLSTSEKVALDKRMQRLPESVIARIARKMLPKVRQAETARVAALHGGGNSAGPDQTPRLKESIEALDQLFLEEFGDLPSDREEGTDSSVKVYAKATPGALEEFELPASSLGIKRGYMPQIDNLEKLGDYCSAKNVALGDDHCDPIDLKASQDNFNQDKINAIMNRLYKSAKPSEPILISKDNYVLDGHHRWLAHLNAGLDIPAKRLDLHAADAIPFLKSYPETYTKTIKEQNEKVQ